MVMKKSNAAATAPADLLAAPANRPEFVAAPDDLIDDVLDAVLQMAPAFCAALAEHRDQLQALAHKISEQKHNEYAGDRVYIPSTTEAARRERSSRNAAILRDHQKGERMALLERRYGLGRTALWKIISGKG
jgi:Mor family transcriptional regulator